MGADPTRHHRGRRFRLRTALRIDLLPAAAALDQRAGGGRAVAGPELRRSAVPCGVRGGGGGCASAARMARVVRRAVVGAGVAEVDRAVRWVSVGRRRLLADGESAAVLGLRGRGAAGFLRGRAAGLRRGCPDAGDHRLVAPRRRVPRRRRASGPDPGNLHRAGFPFGGAGVADSTKGRRGGRRQRAGHGRRGAGQCAATGARLQRPTPRGARQPRRRDVATGRTGAGRAGAAADVRHLAGELLRHRSAGQRRRCAADLPGCRRHRRTDPGRRRGRRRRLQPDQPGVQQHGHRVEPRDRTGGPARQADRATLRRIPALAQLLQQALPVCRPGRLFRARTGRRSRAGRRGPRGSDYLLGGHLRPRTP